MWVHQLLLWWQHLAVQYHLPLQLVHEWVRTFKSIISASAKHQITPDTPHQHKPVEKSVLILRACSMLTALSAASSRVAYTGNSRAFHRLHSLTYTATQQYLALNNTSVNWQSNNKRWWKWTHFAVPNLVNGTKSQLPSTNLLWEATWKEVEYRISPLETVPLLGIQVVPSNKLQATPTIFEPQYERSLACSRFAFTFRLSATSVKGMVYSTWASFNCQHAPIMSKGSEAATDRKQTWHTWQPHPPPRLLCAGMSHQERTDPAVMDPSWKMLASTTQVHTCNAIQSSNASPLPMTHLQSDVADNARWAYADTLPHRT